MRHRIVGRKFNRTANQRKALLKNLCEALIKSGSIFTTLPKAKSLRPVLEKIITKAKKSNLSAYRALLSRFSPEVSKIVRDRIVPACQNRDGGYMRVVKAGFRTGDNAPMAVISFVDEEAYPEEKKLSFLEDLRLKAQKERSET
jgi:large subunit ribosomal protein L17